MWCDNCFLLMPLRHGAMAWAAFIVLYSLAGGILLFLYGQYLFFVYPEWQIYGGIAMAIAASALINIFAFSNRSYIWTNVCLFLWPFVLVITAIRATIMIVELQRGKSKIEWECANGGQLWTTSATAGHVTDIACQIYMLFLNWRYSVRLRHYDGMKGPYFGGYYNT